LAIVRELTTLLDFKVDNTGAEKYAAAVGKVKELALGLAGAFGIAFGAEKLYKLVDGFVDAAKEINKLTYQLTRMARSGDDVGAAMDGLFKTAQDTGIEYTSVLDTYREMLNESKELDVSQSQILSTVDNIYKGLRVGAASSEEISETFAALNRSFRMGRIGRRQFGLLTDIAPAVVDALGSSLGKTREQLEEMAKAGQLTAKVLIDGLGKSITTLDTEFGNRPRKIGEAFTYAWNEVAKLSARLWKLYSVTGRVASIIVWLTDHVKAGLISLAYYTGGLENLIRILGVTLAVVLGPRLITMLVTATQATLSWAAANALVAIQYLAIGAAVAALVLAIDDIMTWMKGGDSIIGDWLGPFDEFAKKWKDLFESSDFFAAFRMIRDLMQGNFGDAWTEFKKTISDVDGLLGGLIVTIGLLTVAWLTFKFFAGVSSLVTGLGKIKTGIVAIITAAGEAKAALTAMSLVSFTPLLAALATIAAALAFLGFIGPAGGEDPEFSKQKNEEYKQNRGDINSGFSGWIRRNFPFVSPNAPGRDGAPSVTPPVPNLVPGSSVAPGGTINNNPTVTQNNNVTITAPTEQMAAEVTTQIQKGAQQILEGLSRQATGAAPRIEAATQ